MLDVDRFKRYNDANGHLAGDRLLKSAAGAWRAALRPYDLLARYGGEEFSLILFGCGRLEAIAVVERLRRVTPGAQTISAGLANGIGAEPATFPRGTGGRRALRRQARRPRPRRGQRGAERAPDSSGTVPPGRGEQRVTPARGCFGRCCGMPFSASSPARSAVPAPAPARRARRSASVAPCPGPGAAGALVVPGSRGPRPRALRGCGAGASSAGSSSREGCRWPGSWRARWHARPGSRGRRDRPGPRGPRPARRRGFDPASEIACAWRGSADVRSVAACAARTVRVRLGARARFALPIRPASPRCAPAPARAAGGRRRDDRRDPGGMCPGATRRRRPMGRRRRVCPFVGGELAAQQQRHGST